MRGGIRFRGIKSTPKNLEKELLATSKKLADDPSLIIPTCMDESRHCPFIKIEKKLQKVLRYKDDPDRLVKLASTGDQLIRAYAATISLAASGKLPYLMSTELPMGQVSFAMRGKVDREKLIGLQHFDDPDLRLLAYWDIARSEKVHVYSTVKGLFCSNEGPKAPAEYVQEMMDSIPYRLVEGSCGHTDRPAVLLRWLSAGKDIRVCAECASDVNTAHHLMGRVAAPDPFDDIQVSVEHTYIGGRPECQGEFTTPNALIQSYLKGEIDDAELISSYVTEKGKWVLSKGQVYVLGQECFGRDGNAFLQALKGSDLEMDALQAVIAKNVPLISDQNQAGKVITEVWEEQGRVMLKAVSDEEIALKVIRMADLTPGQMLIEARRLLQVNQTLSAMPDYEQLGSLGQLADSLARAFKLEGGAAMLRLIERTDKEHRRRTLCYAFLEATGDAHSHKWQFTKEERESGKHLSSYASSMINSFGEDYHQALVGLLRDVGSGETPVKRP